MLSMLCVVVVFGVHSLVDWTWYVPGNALRGAVVRRLAGGSRAAARPPPGRLPTGSGGGERCRGGLLARALRARADRRRERRVLAALLAAWSQWQPQRSEDARAAALGLLAGDPAGARAAAQRAVSRDPLSVEALFTLADVQGVGGQPRWPATLRRAVRLQPSNPQTWLTLARYDLAGDPAVALTGAAGRDLPQPRVDRRRSDRAARIPAPKRSKSTTTTSQALRGERRWERRSEARAHSAREQQAASRPGGPAAPRTTTCSKPKSAMSGVSVAAACRSAGDRRADRSAPRRPVRDSASTAARAARERACSAAGARRSASTRRTSDSQAAVSATCSITSPAQTTSKLASGSPQPFAVHQPQVELGMASARAAQRLLGDVDPDDMRPGSGERAAKRPSPQPTSSTRSPTSTSSTRKRLRTAKSAAQPLGHSLPEGFVVLAGGHRRGG